MTMKQPSMMTALMAILLMTITACAGGLVGSKDEKLA
jgi:hypothetical protein